MLHSRETTPSRVLRRESQSTVSDGDVTANDICKECGHSYSKCICLRCSVCGNLLVQVQNMIVFLTFQKHHCRDCKYPICAKCGIEKNNLWYCQDTDRCDKRRYLILRVMVKNGDDVRQDQMVIQMIRLMNKLLNDVNLNLCLSPYDVVAMKFESY